IKKILLFTLIACFLFTSGVQAQDNFIIDLNYTSFDEGSVVQSGFRANIQERFSVMANINNFSTFMGDFVGLDLLAGVNFEFEPALSNYPSDNTLLAGLRFNEFDDRGFLMKFISRQDFTEDIFLEGDIEFVIWPEADSALKNSLKVGYQIVDEFAVKGGIDSVSSSGNFSWGLSLGMESRF
ncbi:MAG: hypothetical protein ACOCP1_03245, partial [Campylobacterales bacterium]